MSNLIKSCIKVNLAAAKNVSPVKYRWHYEEIGMIGIDYLNPFISNRCL